MWKNKYIRIFEERKDNLNPTEHMDKIIRLLNKKRVNKDELTISDGIIRYGSSSGFFLAKDGTVYYQKDGSPMQKTMGRIELNPLTNRKI